MANWILSIEYVGDLEPFEFFPDHPDDELLKVTLEDVKDLLDQTGLHDFLFTWNYADTLTITVTDIDTGDRVEWGGGTAVLHKKDE